ncbi:hypothetical protein X551_04413 [Methylibium sp. T29]|nr:hypothetical protein X551_04413 [Methylibium sp. T29]
MPVSSSSTQECKERKATPKPAAHICLMASLLDISEPMVSDTPASLNNCSTVVRVPEPRSRTSRLAWFSAARPGLGVVISGCDGAATKAIGCFANAAEMVFSSAGGRPMMARSMSCPASWFTTSARLPICSFTFTCGCSRTNSSSSGGSRYSAVVTAPMRSRPAMSPQCAAIASPASPHRSSMRLA